MKAFKNIVIGDGWSACALIAMLEGETAWIAGSGAFLISPLPSLEAGRGALAWKAVLERLGMEGVEIETGSWLREFRNKSFRQATWTQAPTPGARRDVRDEVIWSPESRFVAAFEAKLGGASLSEVQIRMREALLARPELTRIAGVPIEEVREENEPKEGEEARIVVVLGSGESISAERAFYCDTLPMKGVPKVRNRAPVSAVQAIFTHEAPLDVSLTESFYGHLQREAGEEFQRAVYGHFIDEGKRSLWTTVIRSEELEDNHEIAKRLRRMKQALDKMFGGAGILPEGKDFASTISSEQIRFEENVLFDGGTVQMEPVYNSKSKRLAVLTDGYGPSVALEQVASVMGLKLADADQTADPVVEDAPSREAPAPELSN